MLDKTEADRLQGYADRWFVGGDVRVLSDEERREMNRLFTKALVDLDFPGATYGQG